MHFEIPIKVELKGSASSQFDEPMIRQRLSSLREAEQTAAVREETEYLSRLLHDLLAKD